MVENTILRGVYVAAIRSTTFFELNHATLATPVLQLPYFLIALATIAYFCGIKRQTNTVVASLGPYIGELAPQELATFAIFCKQDQAEVERFQLLPIPISLSYAEFERLLLGMSYHLHVMKKKSEPFEEFLGDMLDSVYKKAGVLVLEE